MKKRITLIVFSVLIMVALYVLYCFNYIPHKKYTNADFNIEAYKSNIDKDNGFTRIFCGIFCIPVYGPSMNTFS